MITKIGIVAGEIWEYLEKHDRKANQEDMVKDLQKDRDLVLMSIGWLAREGHVTVDGACPNCIIRLNPRGQ